jgi:hypothetical protein
MTGWIKLHRSVSDHWVWDCEFSYGQAWIDLICHACHKENTLTIKGQLIQLKRGDQARSEVTLSKTWKWSRNKVRRFLKNLEKDAMIVQKTTHLTSIISICNYDSFQGRDTTDGTGDDTTGGTSKGHLTEHKQECKELKEDKECKESRFDEFWDLYGKKKDRTKCEKKFSKLKDEQVELIFKALPSYIKSTPEIQYRKNPLSWINGECWNDEVDVFVSSEQSSKPEWARGII